jgi:hypothetical protein
VAALQRAVAAAQPQRVAEPVAQHLDLHMARVAEEFLDVDLGVAEGPPRFLAGKGHRVQQLGLVVHHAHAAPATATGRLDHHRVADRARDLQDGRVVIGQ